MIFIFKKTSNKFIICIKVYCFDLKSISKPFKTRLFKDQIYFIRLPPISTANMQPKLGHHQTNAVNMIKKYSETFYKGFIIIIIYYIFETLTCICYFNLFFPPLCFKMKYKPLIVSTIYYN